MFLLQFPYKILRKLKHFFNKSLFFFSGRYQKLRACSIISNNCIGGFIYHELGIEFKSPTINLQLPPGDYVKFIQNLDKYLTMELEVFDNPPLEKFQELGGEQITFPTGKLGDLVIFFQHYQSFAEAKLKWDLRKLRINRNKLRFILVDTNCSLDLITHFFTIPGKKLLITSNPKAAAIAPASTVFMKDMPKDKLWFECNPSDPHQRPYYKIFDYTAWLIND